MIYMGAPRPHPPRQGPYPLHPISFFLAIPAPTRYNAPVLLTLTANDAGGLLLHPIGSQPRLERAFSQSAASGMLDLLRFGLPVGAAPELLWFHARVRELMLRFLRAHRRGQGEESALALLTPASAECTAWLEGMPPLAGVPVSVSMLRRWFAELAPALCRLAARDAISPAEWLSRLGDGWRQLGTLCFHLAENAGEGAAEAPFAFLATFIHTVGQEGKPRHAPLGLAPRLLAEDREGLLSLLRPLRQAAEASPFLAELVNSQSVYRPCAWSPRQAYDFLAAAPALEACGIELRMVNLWKTLPPRVELEVKVEVAPGARDAAKPDKAPALNIHSLLRFVPQVALGGLPLSEEELRELMAGEDGLVRFRGEWVRLDREHLQKLMNSWRQATRMAAGGIPLMVGLRYLLGKRRLALPQLPPPEEGVKVAASDQLAAALANLRLGAQEPDLPPELTKTLRAYQREGVRFLISVTEAGFGACLADDMGLGKTLQLIAWLTHLQRQGELGQGAALIIAPASLLSNWQEELTRFAPQLTTVILHPYALSATELELMQRAPQRLLARAHVALTTYGMATRNALLARCEFPALVLDEAQAIKNAASQRTQAIQKLGLQSPRRVALTGTPVENGLGELRTLFEFLNPGLLGGEKEFSAFVRDMGSDYTPLRRLVRPFLLRRLKSDPALLPELPGKTEQPAWCLMTPEQTRLYACEVENLQTVIHEPDPQTRLALILPLLGRFKQICNHPAQYTGEQFYDPALSGKMSRLGHLAREIAAAGDCCLVFTQYRTLIEPLHDFLMGIFGAPGLTLHGGTPIAERQQRVAAFQHPGGPRFFVLSLKAAGTGLTLTRARHVIHFDRWWNPAVENQASDRAYRIGQTQPVLIHPLITRGSIEENIHLMLRRKTAMADALLAGGLEKMLLELKPEELLALVKGRG